jgi:hypothetical protein
MKSAKKMKEVGKMAYEFLKKLFGNQKDGEEPKAMTYAELEAAIDADKKIQVVDLKAGGYVAKEKLDAKITELDGVKQQLTDANAEIQSYKDMDIDGIKQKAADWEQKYNSETQKLNDKLTKQERDHQMDRYLDTVGLKPGAMYRDYVRRALEEKELKLEDGKFLGADDVMKELKENPDYKDAFVVEEPDHTGNEENAGTEPNGGAPYFSAGTNSQTQEPKGSTFNFGFSGVRKHE